MSKKFITKIEDIRREVNGNKFQAIKTFKSLLPRIENDWFLKQIRVEDVYSHLIKMMTTNSRGNDEVTSPILKEMPQFVSISVCHLFNTMVRLGKFPEKLKIARLTPIHKNGKIKTDPLSYRPISNLNAVEKLIESLLKTQMDKFLEENKVITPKQHGGRKLHSTLTAKIAIDDTITKYRDSTCYRNPDNRPISRI